MRVDTAPRHRNAGRPAHKSAPGFLQFLRGRNCILAHTGECSGKVRACHWDQAGDKGMGSKVSDCWAWPGCDHHHAEQHSIGWNSFVEKYKLDMRDVCKTFWYAWKGRVAWEAKHGK